MASQNEDLIMKLISFNRAALLKGVKQITDAITRAGGIYSGPIFLPTDITKITVQRSPHIDKKSMEQFEKRTHKRCIIIRNISRQMMEALAKDIEFDSVLDIKVKLKPVGNKAINQ